MNPRYLPILVLICAAVSSVSSSNTDAEAWIKAYNDVFGDEPQKLIRYAVEDRVKYLFKEVDNVDVSDDMKNNVRFWYNAITSKDTDNCFVSYLDRLSRKLNIKARPDHPNLPKLLLAVQVNLNEVCLATLQPNIGKILEGKTKRRDLAVILSYYESYTDGDWDEYKFVFRLLHELKTERSSSNERVLKRWKNGPCGKLNAVMDEPEMQDFYEYSLIYTYNGYNEPLPSPKYDAGFWAKAANACRKLDETMPDLLKFNTFTEVFHRRLMMLYKGTGYWISE